jgi:methyl-accepting chemotaxis protein
MQKSWNQMHEVMRLSIEYLRADNYQAYGDLDAQQAQDDMEAVYNRWRAENNTLLKAATEENQSSFTQMQWTLAAFSWPLSPCWWSSGRVYNTCC